MEMERGNKKVEGERDRRVERERLIQGTGPTIDIFIVWESFNHICQGLDGMAACLGLPPDFSSGNRQWPSQTHMLRLLPVSSLRPSKGR